MHESKSTASLLETKPRFRSFVCRKVRPCVNHSCTLVLKNVEHVEISKENVDRFLVV